MTDSKDITKRFTHKIDRIVKSTAHFFQAGKTTASEDITPIFIHTSFGREGSTLLMQLLATSPQIVFDRIYPFEVRYFTYLLRWSLVINQGFTPNESWDAGINFNGQGGLIGPFPYPDAKMWNGKQLWAGCFKAVWHEFSESVKGRDENQAGLPLKYYAEKVPYWVLTYRDQIMPSNLIMLLRDPRDVFLSINAFDKKRGYSGFGRRADDDDWSFAKRVVGIYRDRVKFIKKEKDNPRAILIRYEDLAGDLAGQANRLSEWLGVSFNANNVEKQTARFAHHMTSSNVDESVERWRRELSADLNDFFVNEIGEELQLFGYKI